MSNLWYPFSVLTGGGNGALDSLDGNTLNDGDRAIVVTDSIAYAYVLDATSGAAESSPDVIAPDTNPGTKRWIRIFVYGLPDLIQFENTAPATNCTATQTRALSIGDDNSVTGTGNDSSILGGGGNTLTNDSFSTILGGEDHTLTGTGSGEYNGILSGTSHEITGDGYCNVICGGNYNQETNGSEYSGILNGDSNLIDGCSYAGITSGADIQLTSSDHSIVAGGYDHSMATAGYSVICGGHTNDISSCDYASILGGRNNKVSADGGIVIGGHYAKSYLTYQKAFSSGRFSADGDAQSSDLQAYIETTDASATVLRITGTASVHIVLPASRSWLFNIHAVARQTAGSAGTVGDSAFWNIKGGIKRDASNTTALFGTPTGHGTPGASDRDAAASAWDLTITADDSNESLVLTATGEANKTIHWVAKIELVEAG